MTYAVPRNGKSDWAVSVTETDKKRASAELARLRRAYEAEQRLNFRLMSRLMLLESEQLMQKHYQEDARVLAGASQRILYIGRDRGLCHAVRIEFPFTGDYVDPDSVTLDPDALPGVLIYDRRDQSASVDERFLHLLAGAKRPLLVFVIADSTPPLPGAESLGAHINIYHLPSHVASRSLVEALRGVLPSIEPSSSWRPRSLKHMLLSYQNALMRLALELADGNKTVAARLLETTRVSLGKRLRRL